MTKGQKERRKKGKQKRRIQKQKTRKTKREKKGRTNKTQIGTRDAQVTYKIENDEGMERKTTKANRKE